MADRGFQQEAPHQRPLASNVRATVLASTPLVRRARAPGQAGDHRCRGHHPASPGTVRPVYRGPLQRRPGPSSLGVRPRIAQYRELPQPKDVTLLEPGQVPLLGDGSLAETSRSAAAVPSPALQPAHLLGRRLTRSPFSGVGRSVGRGPTRSAICGVGVRLMCEDDRVKAPHVRQAQASLRTAGSHADNSLGVDEDMAHDPSATTVGKPVQHGRDQTPVPGTTVVCGQLGFTEIRSNSTDRG